MRTSGVVESMEAWWHDDIDVLLALRIKYSRGTEQVSGAILKVL